jgi:thioredoxin reductase (NADPH)
VTGEGGRRLTLLVRAYCHLCDDLLAALAPLAVARGVAVDVVDVDAPEHAALEAAWGDAVPVLFAGPPAPAHELCRYRFDPDRVAAALAAADGIARKPEIR